jgi:peroxiredoxin
MTTIQSFYFSRWLLPELAQKKCAPFPTALMNIETVGAKVVGISVDGTFVQKAFAKSSNISFPLLSDFNKEVIQKV